MADVVEERRVRDQLRPLSGSRGRIVLFLQQPESRSREMIDPQRVIEPRVRGTRIDEVREADLLLHVVDISHPQFEDHIASVNQIMDEIGGSDKPMLMVFNKIDQYTHKTIDEDDLVTERTEEHFTLEEWERTWMSRVDGDAIFISALNKDNMEAFRKKVYDRVREIHITRFPYNNFLYPEYDAYGEEE